MMSKNGLFGRRVLKSLITAAVSTLKAPGPLSHVLRALTIIKV